MYLFVIKALLRHGPLRPAGIGQPMSGKGGKSFPA